jgi:hypothetical protein
MGAKCDMGECELYLQKYGENRNAINNAQR